MCQTIFLLCSELRFTATTPLTGLQSLLATFLEARHPPVNTGFMGTVLASQLRNRHSVLPMSDGFHADYFPLEMGDFTTVKLAQEHLFSEVKIYLIVCLKVFAHVNIVKPH